MPAAGLVRDLNNIRIFVAVVQAGSFTDAGKALGMPTSTVSRRVARLEAELGVRLLQRTTRRLSLTDGGRIYYERTAQVLVELDEAESILSHAQSTPRGRVRVAAPAEHRITTALINAFLEKWPEVSVDVEFSGRAVNLLEEGFDIHFCAGPPTNLSVVAHKLMDSPFVVVASPDYLARRGTPARVADLAEHDCLVFGGASDAGRWLLADGPVAVRGRFGGNNLGAIRAAAIAGHGIALLPWLACAAAVEAGTLTVILPRAAPPPVPLYITYAAGRLMPAAVRAFIDLARARFAEMAEPDPTAR